MSISEEERDQWHAAAARARQAARERVQAEVPAGVTFTDEESAFLSRVCFETNGVLLAQILRKVADQARWNAEDFKAEQSAKIERNDP